MAPLRGFNEWDRVGIVGLDKAHTVLLTAGVAGLRAQALHVRQEAIGIVLLTRPLKAWEVFADLSVIVAGVACSWANFLHVFGIAEVFVVTALPAEFRVVLAWNLDWIRLWFLRCASVCIDRLHRGTARVACLGALARHAWIYGAIVLDTLTV